MIHFFVGLKYTENPEQLQDKNKMPDVKSQIMFQLMMIVGISRLFNRCTVKEFLFRVAIALNKYAVIKNFFTNDKVIEVEYDGTTVELYLQDIINHIGLEINDDEYPYVARGMWMKNIDTFWKNAAAGAALSGVPIVAIKHIGGNSFYLGTNKPGKPDDEIINAGKRTHKNFPGYA